MKQLNSHGGPELAAAVRRAYAVGQSDYTMKPLVRRNQDGAPMGRVKEGDTVLFACRRGEREIELTEMFTDPRFNRVERHYLPGLKFVILTLYHEKFRHLPVAFAPSQVERSLAQAVSEAGLRQLHCAESEKYAHVTFFFNGGVSTPFPGEDDVCIPSPKGVAFEDRPELSLAAVVDETVGRLRGAPYHFAVVNFANGDIIGHTSSEEAKIAAAGHISRQLCRLVDAARAEGYVVAVTADHGNLEQMTTAGGKPHVAHTASLVPFVLIGPQGERFALRDGSLCNVAPTMLELMGLEKPPEMTAASLLAAGAPGQGRKVLLVILDGWGYGPSDATNPIFVGATDGWDTLLAEHPRCSLHASGGHVGLGDGKAGNSEAGHLNLGAGRVVPQDDLRLEAAIRDGAFAQNEALRTMVDNARSNGKALHILTLLTEKSSHGSVDYATALCRVACDLPELYLHIIFDGRSTEPGSAPDLLLKLEETLREIGAGQIVDGVGRGLVLDRDGHYEKVKLGYDAMVLGTGECY